MGRNAVVVLGHCSRNRAGFGIRFERSERDQWTATWAFAMKEGVAKREGYDGSTISGSFVFDPAFPGCPHCAARSFWVCGNGQHVACWDGDSRHVTCPQCGAQGELGGAVEQLDAGGDR